MHTNLIGSLIYERGLDWGLEWGLHLSCRFYLNSDIKHDPIPSSSRVRLIPAPQICSEPHSRVEFGAGIRVMSIAEFGMHGDIGYL